MDLVESIGESLLRWARNPQHTREDLAYLLSVAWDSERNPGLESLPRDLRTMTRQQALVIAQDLAVLADWNHESEALEAHLERTPGLGFDEVAAEVRRSSHLL